MFLCHISSSNFYSLFFFKSKGIWSKNVSVSFGYINSLGLDSLQEIKVE